jgi:hypothetical protein
VTITIAINVSWAFNISIALFMGYYAASSDTLLPTLRDNLSVPSSGVKNPKAEFRNYHHSVRNNP